MTYRFHQLLNATGNPHKALAESTPSAAMLGGVLCEAIVAERLGFTPWLPDGVEFTDAERSQYALQAQIAASAIMALNPNGLDIHYQPPLAWPYAKGRYVDGVETAEARAEGHPDFLIHADRHIIDLKTTEYPTEEWVNKLLHSIQMCAYMAAYARQYGVVPKLSIVLASRLETPDPVKFNKDGSVSLSGQNADHHSLMEAVTMMGEKADDRHWAMVYKAPVWNPVITGTLEQDECEQLASVGAIFLDAGLAVLDTGLAESVHRPYH